MFLPTKAASLRAPTGHPQFTTLAVHYNLIATHCVLSEGYTLGHAALTSSLEAAKAVACVAEAVAWVAESTEAALAVQ